MFVKKGPPTKDERVCLYFVEGYRENGKIKQRTIERIGFVDEFTHLYKDPLEHFKEIAIQKTKEKQERLKSITIELDPEAILPFDENTDSYDCVKTLAMPPSVRYFIHSVSTSSLMTDANTLSVNTISLQ